MPLSVAEDVIETIHISDVEYGHVDRPNEEEEEGAPSCDIGSDSGDSTDGSFSDDFTGSNGQVARRHIVTKASSAKSTPPMTPPSSSSVHGHRCHHTDCDGRRHERGYRKLLHAVTGAGRAAEARLFSVASGKDQDESGYGSCDKNDGDCRGHWSDDDCHCARSIAGKDSTSRQENTTATPSPSSSSCPSPLRAARQHRHPNKRRQPVRCRASKCCRRLFGVFVFLAACWGAFDVGWKAYWVSGCKEGCYKAAETATGSNGPEQIHLAYSGVDAEGNPTGMTVSWTSAAGEAGPVVEYGFSKDELNMSVRGTSARYLDTVHHRVTLEDVAPPDTRIFYRCGHPSSLPSPSPATTELDVVGPAAGEDNRHQSAADSESPTFDVSKAPLSDRNVDDGPGDEGGRPEGTLQHRVVENHGGWSEVSSFLTAGGPGRWDGDGPWDRPLSVAVVGDFGLVNAGATFERLHQLVEDEEVDFVIHLGDIAYADDAFLERPWVFGYEEKWDAFMRRASHDFATKVPYMVVPGNHEAECHSPACAFFPHRMKALSHFKAYNSRFRMPSIESGADHGVSMWYSYNVGPVHFVVVSTETDFLGASSGHFARSSGDGVGNGGFGDQLAWLEEDLAQADQERDVRPWIVVTGHRPMYSRENLDEAGRSGGDAKTIQAIFEPLFEKYRADIYICGHVHAMERSFPVSQDVIRFNGNGNIRDSAINHGDDGAGKNALPPITRSMVYDDPTATVHLVSGAGGNIEGMTVPNELLREDTPQWHAFSTTLGAGVNILSFPSMSEMRSTFVTSDSPAQVLDKLTIRHRRPPLAS